MHRRHLLGAALLAAIVPKPSGAQEAARLPVIATFSILGDMVATVGGARVAIRTLVGPDQDVHIYEPTPKDLRDLLASAAVIENGLGLEGWMARLTGAAGFKGRIIQAAAQVTPRRMKEDSGAIATDPHAWQNPRNGVLYAQAIAAGLSAADPSHAAAYADAAQHYADAIGQADARIEATFAPIPPGQRRIITTHDAFGYYGARYGIEFLAAEGISTESEPSAKAIAALVQQIKREKIHAVFIENMTGDRMARMLARETGAALGGTVYSDALSPPGGPAATYLTMLDHNTRLFAAAMKRS